MIKKCEICKKEFEAKGMSKFCSDECKKNNNRERNKKWRQNNREKANSYTKTYREKNKEKLKEKARERWLKKRGIEELSEKGKKAVYTKNINRVIEKEILTCDVNCLLEELGDIE